MIKIEIENRERSYIVLLDQTENIKVLINDIQVLEETVSSGKQARIRFKFQEAVFEE